MKNLGKRFQKLRVEICYFCPKEMISVVLDTKQAVNRKVGIVLADEDAAGNASSTRSSRLNSNLHVAYGN